MVFHQPLRQQQGFVDSLLTLFKINLTAPNYSVVSRRSSGLRTQLNTLKSDLDKARQSKSGKIVMIVDSTGIKIYGEGEWMSKKHKTKVRKSWRKLHISCDTDSWISGSTVTDHRTSDTSQVGALRDQLDSDIDRFIGDGAYDSKGVFNNLIDKNDHQPELIVPPMDVAVISSDPEFKQRNNHISFINDYRPNMPEAVKTYTSIELLVGMSINFAISSIYSPTISFMCVVLCCFSFIFTS